MEENPLYIIRTFSKDVDARLAEAVLEANGIDSIIIGDNAGAWLSYLDSLHPIRLAVKQSDVEDALKILDSDVSEQSGG
ncbi:MAG TPA: DUF2007 domain-containing protein [Gemmatimonadaceae bacterium]